jgi:hypothetical protein
LIDEGNTIKSVEIKSATTINSHFFRDWIFIKI